jgi:MFS family permease
MAETLTMRLGVIGRSCDFRLLWTAHSISTFGDAITLVALPSIAILTLHVGALAVGVLSAMQGAAWGVFGLVAGVWVDRLPRRAVMIACDLARLLLVGSVPVVAAFGRLTIWQLAAVAALAGVGTVFFLTASSTYVPELLEHTDLTEANARLELSTSTSMLSGPPAAGALIAAVGAPFAMAADAASFLVSALFLRSIEHTHPRAPAAARERFRSELAQGLRAVRERPVLIFITSATGVSNFGLAAQQAVLLLFVYRGLHLHPLAAGVALGLGAAGNVAGAALAPRATRMLGSGRALLAATTLEGLGLLLILPALVAAPALWVAVALAARGLFNPLWNVNAVTVRQVIVPRELQGRVSAALRMVGIGTWPLGALAGGAAGGVLASSLGAAHGYALTLALASLVAASSGALLLPRRVRELRV